MATTLPDFAIPLYPEDLEVEVGGNRFWLRAESVPDFASAAADADAALDSALRGARGRAARSLRAAPAIPPPALPPAAPSPLPFFSRRRRRGAGRGAAAVPRGAR
jgi:hypothetical protein